MEKIDYPLSYKQFTGVKFISSDPTSGNRIKLDPRDFNEMQDIWLQHIDNFIKAVRGNDIGVIEGCEVRVQQKQNVDSDTSVYEAVVSPGYVYVNAALIRIVFNHSLELPTERDWSGFKNYYLVLVPEIREFAPTQLGEPGMSAMAGRTTSHRMEIGFSLGLVDEIPNAPPINSPLFTEALMSSESFEALSRKHNIPWFVVLSEIKIRNIISGLEDIIIDNSNVSRLMVISQVQSIAIGAAESIQKHIKSFLHKEPLVGEIDGINKIFYFADNYQLLPDSKHLFSLYLNNELLENTYYEIQKTDDWITSSNHYNKYFIEFYDAPSAGSILSASYFVDHHPQYLSNFSFAEHCESSDHDERYYTESEDDIWRDAHNNSDASHPLHLTRASFENWKLQHISAETTEHDNAYTRLGHRHSIGDTDELQDNLVELSQCIGYGNDDHYIVSQEIYENVDGENKIFPLTCELLDNGEGYLKNVRADISHDSVKNPALLSIIDASDEFSSESGAFSVAKQVSMQNYNKKPCSVIQSDGEVWSIWASTNLSNYDSEIWFASYKQGDGFFSPSTPTGLSCHENSRISADTITSLVPSIDQRIVLVWYFDGLIRYTYIDKGQTSWAEHLVSIPNTEDCIDPAIKWVSDGTALGRLHLVYRKRSDSGKWAIYRRIFELDLTEYGNEKKLSGDQEHYFNPIILQDRTNLKRVWYGWIKQPATSTSDNDCLFEAIVMGNNSDAIYIPCFNLGGAQDLNSESSISWANNQSGIYAQFSRLVGSSFETLYLQLNTNGSIISEATFFVASQNQTVVIANDDSIWSFYDHIGTIYYRALQQGIGNVKWNKALRYIEFQSPPVNGSVIWLDIAVPIKSLNARVSELESQKASDEEALAVKIRAAISSMGLGFPLARLAALKEKIIVESSIEMDNRREVYGYDVVFYDKFFASYNNEKLRPAGCNDTVIKGGNPTAFQNSGLIYDEMGKITNPTGKTIKIYSTIRQKTDFLSNGFVRLEIRGEAELECVEARITSNMHPDPTSTTINWFPIAKTNIGKEIDMSSYLTFMSSGDFGIEITLLPGGYIYDWALFLKKGYN